MTDGDALLRAILLKPAEDTPRLVYADWLQERGQAERAWLIRFQVAPDNRYIHDGTEEYALIEKRAADWFHLRELSGRKRNRLSHDYYAADYGWPMLRIRPPRARGDWYELAIRCGFVAEVSLTLAAFVRHAEALFRAHPIERVTLTDREPWYSTWPRGWLVGDRPGVIGSQNVVCVTDNWCPMLDTAQDAAAWLSARCVAYGRTLAGLSA